MKRPEPEIGMVIKYDFLWSDEKKQGYEEGKKSRRCVVITSVEKQEDGRWEVLVAPITHNPQGKGDKPIEVPHKVGKHLGMDDQRSFIATHEANSLDWEDPGHEPVKPGTKWEYGRIPFKLYQQVKSQMQHTMKRKALNVVNRQSQSKKIEKSRKNQAR